MTTSRAFDYDFIVVGSGFGGSVSGLRLTEKGYRVLMLEKGRLAKTEPTFQYDHGFGIDEFC